MVCSGTALTVLGTTFAAQLIAEQAAPACAGEPKPTCPKSRTHFIKRIESDIWVKAISDSCRCSKDAID